MRDPEPLVEPIGAAAARTLWVGRQGFALDVSRPGDFLVRVNFTPYWSIARGAGCLLRRGDWTIARAVAPRHPPGRRRLLPRPRLERRHRRQQDLLRGAATQIDVLVASCRHATIRVLDAAAPQRARESGSSSSARMRARNSAPWAP